MYDKCNDAENPVSLHYSSTTHRHVDLPVELAQEQAPDHPRYTHEKESKPRTDVDNGNDELDGKHEQVALENQFVVNCVEAKSLLPHSLLVLNDHAFDDVRSWVNLLLIKAATESRRTTGSRHRWQFIFIIDQIVHPLISLPSIHF